MMWPQHIFEGRPRNHAIRPPFTADAVLEIKGMLRLFIPVGTEYIMLNSYGFIDVVKSCFLICKMFRKTEAVADIQ